MKSEISYEVWKMYFHFLVYNSSFYRTDCKSINGIRFAFSDDNNREWSTCMLTPVRE